MKSHLKSPRSLQSFPATGLELEHRAVPVRRVLDSYVFGWSLYQVCEVQRSSSEIRRAPVQTGLTGTPTVSTKVQSGLPA